MASPHAPVHLWIGGNLDCGTMYNKIGALVGSDIAKTLAFMSNGHRKGLFLSNAWGCNRSALVDEKPHEVRRTLSMNTQMEEEKSNTSSCSLDVVSNHSTLVGWQAFFVLEKTWGDGGGSV